MRSRGTQGLILLVLALAALISAALVSGPPSTAEGVRLLPLDSTYTALVYGRNFEAGRGLTFNPGDSPAPFHADPLYTALLALLYRSGFDEASLPGLLVTLGRLLFIANALLIADLTRRLAVPLLHAGPVQPWAAGLIGGLLFTLNGWVAYHHVAGPDAALLTLLLLGAAWAFAAEIPWLAVAVVLLAALTRIEMLALLLAVPLAWRRGPRGWIALLLPLIAGAVLIGASGWSTDYVSLHPLPLAAFAQNAFDLLVFVFNGLGAPGYGQAFALPLALITALAGWWISRGRHTEESADTPALLLALSLIGVLLAASQPAPAFDRYRSVAPFYPALITLAALALAALLNWLAGPKPAAQATLAPALLLSLLIGAHGWYSLAAFRAAYTEDLTRSAERAVLAAWIEDELSLNEWIGGQAPGLIRWMTGHRVLDLSGRFSPAISAAARNGPGSVFEALVEMEPDYLIYDSRLDSFVPPGQVAYELPMSSEAVNPPRLELIAWGWDQAGAADVYPIHPDLDPLDRIDVAFITDEDAHVYQPDPTAGITQVLNLPQGGPDGRLLMEGVRPNLTGERFRVAAQPGKPLLIAGFVMAEQNLSLHVFIDGQNAGLWRFAAGPGLWQTRIFAIPAELVQSDQAEIELRAEGGGTYTAARYHIYAAGYYPPLVDSPIRIDAAFDGQMRLIGALMDDQRLPQGGQIALALNWEALNPPTDGSNLLRLFVHLVDASAPDDPASLRAQIDIEPGGPLQPFWTWQPGQQGTTSFALPLPADLPPGDYLILIGLYTLNDGQRLPITAGVDFGASRVLITSFEVR